MVTEGVGDCTIFGVITRTRTLGEDGKKLKVPEQVSQPIQDQGLTSNQGPNTFSLKNYATTHEILTGLKVGDLITITLIITCTAPDGTVSTSSDSITYEIVKK